MLFVLLVNFLSFRFTLSQFLFYHLLYGTLSSVIFLLIISLWIRLNHHYLIWRLFRFQGKFTFITSHLLSNVTWWKQISPRVDRCIFKIFSGNINAYDGVFSSLCWKTYLFIFFVALMATNPINMHSVLHSNLINVIDWYTAVIEWTERKQQKATETFEVRQNVIKSRITVANWDYAGRR